MDDRIVYVIDFSPTAKLHCHGLMCTPYPPRVLRFQYTYPRSWVHWL